jgi:hypothetical protein
MRKKKKKTHGRKEHIASIPFGPLSCRVNSVESRDAGGEDGTVLERLLTCGRCPSKAKRGCARRRIACEVFAVCQAVCGAGASLAFRVSWPAEEDRQDSLSLASSCLRADDKVPGAACRWCSPMPAHVANDSSTLPLYTRETSARSLSL